MVWKDTKKIGEITMGLFDKKRSEVIKIKIEDLIEWNEPNGNGCVVSDRITKDGFKVGYMYREQPNVQSPDSGWRFLAGNEDNEYMTNSNNHHIFAINTVCNYDKDIISFLHSKIGSCYIRTDSHNFELDDGTKQIYVEKQKR